MKACVILCTVQHSLYLLNHLNKENILFIHIFTNNNENFNGLHTDTLSLFSFELTQDVHFRIS